MIAAVLGEEVTYPWSDAEDDAPRLFEDEGALSRGFGRWDRAVDVGGAAGDVADIVDCGVDVEVCELWENRQ